MSHRRELSNVLATSVIKVNDAKHWSIIVRRLRVPITVFASHSIAITRVNVWRISTMERIVKFFDGEHGSWTW